MVMSSEPCGHRPALHLLNPGGQPGGQRHAAGRDAEQHHLFRALGPLDDLVRDPGQHAADLSVLEDGLAGAGGGYALAGAGIAAAEDARVIRTSFPASPDGP